MHPRATWEHPNSAKAVFLSARFPLRGETRDGRVRDPGSPERASLQPIDDLQIRKDAEITVGVRLTVGRRHHPVDRGESRSIGGTYLFPGFLAPRGDLVTREPQGDLSLPIKVQPSAFSIESHRYVLWRQAGERRRLSTSERVEIDSAIRAPHGGELAVRRDGALEVSVSL